MHKTIKHTLEDLKKLITKKTKLIIINTPHNPTGGVLKKELIEELADLAKKHDLWVLSDEIYDRIVHEGEHFSITNVEGMPERTVVLNGCSKAYAMTGYRIGWAVTKNKDMAKAIEQLACNDTSCTNTMAQFAALEAITGPQEPIEEMVKEYKKRRDLLHSLINEIPGMHCKPPKGAFYLMVNVREILNKLNISAAKLCDMIMEEAHVLILPGTCFGLFGDDFVRFSYVSTEANIIEGAARIKKYIEKFYK